MKKSQILAAFALAFALGVVAPVANIVSDSSVSALSFEAGKESATPDEVAKTISAVENNDAYKKAMTVIDAYTAYDEGATATPATIAEFDVAKAGKIASRASKFGLTAPIAGVAVNQPVATIADAQAVIAAIKDSDDYKLYDNLAVAVESKDKVALMTAITAYNEAKPGSKITVANLTDDTKFDVDTAIAAVNNSSALNDYNEFNGAVTATEANIAAYEKGLNILQPVLTSGVLSAAGQTAYDNALKSDGSETYSLSALAGIINNGTRYNDNNFASNLKLTAWNTVNAKLGTNYDKSEATKANYTLIHDIAVAYRTATGSDAAVSVIMTELSGYAGGETEDPSEITKISSGNVTIFANGFSFPAGTKMIVNKINASDIKGFAGFGALKNVIFDIEILNADGSEFDMAGKNVTVIIEAEGFSNRAEGFHISDDGKTLTALVGENYADGAMVFTTDHFSYYAIVETNPIVSGTEDSDKKEDKKPEATKTGSQGIVAKGAASASKTAGVMAAIATALTTAGAAVVAFRNARRNGNKEA